jgi:hypothetical protein
MDFSNCVKSERVYDVRKTFYKTMIIERYTKILAHVYEMLKG